jgi:hypothetical protein
MASLYSNLATLQSSISTEGIRKACQHFQVFKKIKKKKKKKKCIQIAN